MLLRGTADRGPAPGPPWAEQLGGEAVTDREWIEAFAASLGVEPPSQEDFTALLALAGVAAHASKRTAAPVACWLVARAGIDAQAALVIAEQIAGEPE